MPLSLTDAQMNVITAFGESGNYPGMYGYIASAMRSGQIAGATQNQICCFTQAPSINQNDPNAPSSVFIRAVTSGGC